MAGYPLVISPHFDDAVLSCGHWLQGQPGAVVATVCSGDPGPGVPASEEWDALAHFATATEATTARRAEDEAALAVLGGEQRLLGFLDEPYRAGAPLDETELEETLVALLDELRPSCCLAPLGIFHVDHQSTGRAARAALRRAPRCPAIAYCDLPYALLPDGPDLVADGLKVVEAEGMHVAEFPAARPVKRKAKRQAEACYASQLYLLGKPLVKKTLRIDAERFWRLEPMG